MSDFSGKQVLDLENVIESDIWCLQREIRSFLKRWTYAKWGCAILTIYFFSTAANDLPQAWVGVAFAVLLFFMNVAERRDDIGHIGTFIVLAYLAFLIYACLSNFYDLFIDWSYYSTEAVVLVSFVGLLLAFIIYYPLNLLYERYNYRKDVKALGGWSMYEEYEKYFTAQVKKRTTKNQVD